jgi:phage shock protein A
MELLKDRSHYRKCEDSHLLEEARYSPNAELAIVLGERLEAVWEEYEAEIGEVTEHAKELEEDVDRHLRTIEELREHIYQLEREVEELEQSKEQNDD